MIKKDEVVVCDKCKGNGEVIVEYYKSHKEPHIAKCSICHGTGRMLKTTTVKLMPLVKSISNLERICN